MQDIIDYELINTDDGSPSLRLKATAEPMHNLKGAFSESVSIYLSAMEQAYEKTQVLHVLSIGMGLAYNEMLFAALCLASEVDDAKFCSFEKDANLRNGFASWLNREDTPFSESFDQVLILCANHFSLDPVMLFNSLGFMINIGQIKLRAELRADTEFQERYTCVLFDPFCANTNPELWSEEFLSDFILKVSDEHCLLSTYAAKGNLTRALKINNYQVNLLEGYAGKRNRTLAHR